MKLNQFSRYDFSGVVKAILELPDLQRLADRSWNTTKFLLVRNHQSFYILSFDYSDFTNQVQTLFEQNLDSVMETAFYTSSEDSSSDQYYLQGTSIRILSLDYRIRASGSELHSIFKHHELFDVLLDDPLTFKKLSMAINYAFTSN